MLVWGGRGVTLTPDAAGTKTRGAGWGMGHAGLTPRAEGLGTAWWAPG